MGCAANPRSDMQGSCAVSAARGPGLTACDMLSSSRPMQADLPKKTTAVGGKLAIGASCCFGGWHALHVAIAPNCFRSSRLGACGMARCFRRRAVAAVPVASELSYVRVKVERLTEDTRFSAQHGTCRLQQCSVQSRVDGEITQIRSRGGMVQHATRWNYRPPAAAAQLDQQIANPAEGRSAASGHGSTSSATRRCQYRLDAAQLSTAVAGRSYKALTQHARKSIRAHSLSLLG